MSGHKAPPTICVARFHEFEDTPESNSLAFRGAVRSLGGVFSFWKKLRAEVPGPFLAALGLSVGFLAFVAWDQSHWWRIKEDYQFGWLVPALAAFVIYDRWPRILAALGACADAGSPRVAG